MLSYNIGTPYHYDAGKVPGSSISKTIDIKSNILGRTHEAPTVGSHKHFEGMPPIVYQKPNGEFFARHSTSGNPYRWEVPVEDAFENRYFSPQLDDIGFKTWKDACEKPQAVEYVKLPQKSILHGLIESFGERKLKLLEGDTPVELFVHDTQYTGRINKFGKFSHLERNLKQHLTEYYRTQEAQALVSFMKSHGLELEDIGYLAAGFLPERTKYAVNRATDGKVIFFAAEDANEHVVSDARIFGEGAEDDRIRTFHEEMMHIARKSYDKLSRGKNSIREEEDTKSDVRDFYLEMAKGANGNPQLVSYFLKQAAIMEWDRATTKKRYSNIKWHDEDLESRVEGEESETNPNSSYVRGANGNLIYMPDRTSNSKARKGEGVAGKVLYGKFVKPEYIDRDNAETDSPKADARSSKSASKANSEARGESAPEPSEGAPDGESTAEAT